MESITVSQFFLWLGSQFIVAAAIWGGIRADIKSMHVLIVAAQKSADQAHERLDRHLDHLNVK